jgi:hypothetical protein
MRNKLFLTTLLLVGCGVVQLEGPITPDKLDPGQICEEFFAGPQLIGSVCVVNPLDLLTAERSFLADHPQTTGIRRMR